MRPRPSARPSAAAATTPAHLCAAGVILTALLAPAVALGMARPVTPVKPADKAKPPELPLIVKFLARRRRASAPRR